MTDIDIDAIRPATDLLLLRLRETVGEIQAHDHPDGGSMPDLYCLNLTGFLGERMGPVLRRLADEQAEARKWQEKHTALADEFLAEADRLHAKIAELTAALTQSRAQAGTYANEIGTLTAENARLRQQRDEAIEGVGRCHHGARLDVECRPCLVETYGQREAEATR